MTPTCIESTSLYKQNALSALGQRGEQRARFSEIIEKHINWCALTFPLSYVSAYDGGAAAALRRRAEPPKTINLHISPLKQTFFAIPQNYAHMGIFR